MLFDRRRLLGGLLLAAAGSRPAGAQDFGGDPYQSHQWLGLRKEFFGTAPLQFDDRVQVRGPAFAEDPMNVPISVMVPPAVGPVEQIMVIVDRNPIRKVLEFFPVDERAASKCAVAGPESVPWARSTSASTKASDVGVAPRKRMRRGSVALVQTLAVEHACQQPVELRARVAAGGLQITQHHAFVGPIEPRITQALGDRDDVGVAGVIAVGHAKTHFQRARQEGLKLGKQFADGSRPCRSPCGK